MSRDRVPFGPRPSGWWAVAAATVLAVTGLTQCRMMPESLTGIEVHRGGLSAKSDCIRGCNDAFQAGREAEESRHRDALQACGSDVACKHAESALHTANLQALVDQQRGCKNACYNEGSGDGGR
jgi:hypothetical protein